MLFAGELPLLKQLLPLHIQQEMIEFSREQARAKQIKVKQNKIKQNKAKVKSDIEDESKEDRKIVL